MTASHGCHRVSRWRFHEILLSRRASVGYKGKASHHGVKLFFIFWKISQDAFAGSRHPVEELGPGDKAC
jgi:hypothetical protein